MNFINYHVKVELVEPWGNLMVERLVYDGKVTGFKKKKKKKRIGG